MKDSKVAKFLEFYTIVGAKIQESENPKMAELLN